MLANLGRAKISFTVTVQHDGLGYNLTRHQLGGPVRSGWTFFLDQKVLYNICMLGRVEICPDVSKSDQSGRV